MENGETEFGRLLVAAQRSLRLHLCALFPGEWQEVDNLAQETNRRALENEASYDFARPFWPWLRTIATHCAVDFARRRAASPAVFDSELVAKLGETAASEEISHRLDGSSEQVENLRRCLGKVPPEKRTLLAERYIHGAQVNELARKRNVTAGSISTLFYHLRKSLRNCIEKHTKKTNASRHKFFEQHLDRLFDGTLPPQEMQELAGALKQSRQLRAEYLLQAHLHILLAGTHPAVSGKRRIRVAAIAACIAAMLGLCAFAATKHFTLRASSAYVPAETLAQTLQTQETNEMKTAKIAIATATVAAAPVLLEAATSPALPTRTLDSSEEQGALLYETGNYVQQDLVLHYDALRNAGEFAPHSVTASTWKDLASGNDAEFTLFNGTGGYWTEDSYCFNGAVVALTQNAVPAGEHYTIQLLVDVDTSTAGQKSKDVILSSPMANWKYGSIYGKDYSKVMHVTDEITGGAWNKRAERAGTHFTRITAVRDGNRATIFLNDTLPDDSDTSLTTGWQVGASGKSVTASKWIFGDFPEQASVKTGKGMFGKVKSVRVYNKVLSNEELAANKALDEIRYGGEGIPVTNAVVATSIPGIEGNEGSGVYAVDGQYTFSAPERITKGEDTWECFGYELETWSDGEWNKEGLFRFPFCTVASTEKVRITWIWKHISGPDFLDTAQYVQDSLFFHLDGIRNAGADKEHDSAAATWKDLSTFANDVSLVKPDGAQDRWGKRGYVFTAGGYGQTSKFIPLSSRSTIQITGNISTNGQDQFLVDTKNVDPVLFSPKTGSNGSIWIKDKRRLTYQTDTMTGSKWDTRATLYSSYFTSVNAILDGRRTALFSGTNYPADTNVKPETGWAVGTKSVPYTNETWTIGGLSNGRYLAGVVQSIRVYERLLTERELEWNKMLDDIRFSGEPSADNMVIVTSDREGFSGDQLNGAYRPLAYTFTASSDIVKGTDKDWQLAGYRLETWDAGSRSWRYPVEYLGETSWRSPAEEGYASRRLTWLWKPVSGLKTYGAGDYVQADLVLQLDGLEGSGGNRWLDLSGEGHDVSFQSLSGNTSSWCAKGYSFDGYAIGLLSGKLDLGNAFTIEFQGNVDASLGGNGNFPSLFAGDGISIYTSDSKKVCFNTDATTGHNWETRALFGNWNGRYCTSLFDSDGATWSATAVTPNDSRPAGFVQNGAFKKTIAAQSFYVGNGYPVVYNSNRFKGEIHSLRIYRRALTSEELAHNRRVDAARYDGVTPATNVLVVAKYPDAATESVGPHEVEGEWTFTASDAADGNRTRKVTGYSIEAWTGDKWGPAVFYSGNSYTYKSGEAPDKVRLTWKWSGDGTCIMLIGI